MRSQPGPSEHKTPRRAAVTLRGALAGVLAASVALGVAQLVAGIFERGISPVVAVGEWMIDHAPTSLKTYAIRQFGTNDKPALVIGTFIVLILLAAVLGALSVWHPRVGAAGVAGLGVLGMAASAARPDATLASPLPSIVGAVAGMVTLVSLAPRAGAPAERPGDDERPGYDRRRFLLLGAAAAGTAAVAGGAGQFLRKRFSVASARARVSLPAPRWPAVALPASADLGTRGVEPFVTSNGDFYRVDTALLTPQVRPDTWKLRIHGMVDRELTLTYDQLLARPLVERHITLVCVSNEVGGHYAGTARWLGVPVADLLHEAGLKPGADQMVSRSVDGWTAGSPTSVVLDGRDALVAVGMNGEPLPVGHGFPARLVVPGLYGYLSATKWLTEIELTTFDAFDAYWVRRHYAKQAPIKTFARIDTPRGLSRIPAGKTAIAGVAWAIHRGVSAVEVRIDDGQWQPARLSDVATRDTWRQWLYEWDATPGSHTLTVRSTDGTGALQTERRTDPLPDGATGWHSVVVFVS